MTDSIMKVGFVPFFVEKLGQECKTYYKIAREILSGSHPPLLVLHGGPGAGHEYLLGLAELYQQYSIPVIFYDQIGNGQSTRLPETKGDATLWNEDLFLSELKNLIDHMNLAKSGFSIFGQSWGGMLASSFATSNPPGLEKLILANTPADVKLWKQSIQQLRSALPPEIQETINKAEAAQDYESPAYLDAVCVFYRKHLCNVEPWPAPEVAAAIRWLTEDTTVYGTMNGPSELTLTGSLTGWSVIDRLHNVSVPTLVYNGSKDDAQDICVEPFFWKIPKVKWVVIDGATHFAHVERKDYVIKLVGDFLLAK